MNALRPSSLLSRLLNKAFGLLAVILAVSPAVSQAQSTWYLNATQGTGRHWNEVTFWSDGPTGGANPSAMSLADTYDSNARTLRTEAGNTASFQGGTLLLNSSLSLKAVTTTISGKLVTLSSGASIVNNGADAISQVLTLSINHLTVGGETRVASITSQGRSLAFNVTTLDGDGDLYFGKTSTSTTVDSAFTFRATSATNYTGDIHVFGTNRANNSFSFSQNLISGGGLFLEANTVMSLGSSRSLTFASVSIGGSELLPREAAYTFAELNGAYDLFFANGGNGTILVTGIPEPSTYAAIFGGLVGALVVVRRRRKQAA